MRRKPRWLRLVDSVFNDSRLESGFIIISFRVCVLAESLARSACVTSGSEVPLFFNNSTAVEVQILMSHLRPMGLHGLGNHSLP